MADWSESLDRLARDRAKAGLTRHLRPRPADDDVVDLAGNDYLGLSRHVAVTSAARSAIAAYGVGATGSRLVRGSTDAHTALESGLAGWLGAEAALVFSSGYLANLAVVRAAAAVCDLVVSDAYNHASLIDGCKISGRPVVVAPHNDPAAVAAILDAHPGRTAAVVTESVFSVDGDLAPLAALHAVTTARGALLIVDDAHALGLLGPAGAGGVVAAGLAGQPDVIVTATLSKSLGGAGGVVAGPARVIRHLIDTGRTFIYDTAPPPAVVAGVHAAIDLARAADDRRATLTARGQRLAARLRAAGYPVRDPAAGVLSVVAPGPEAALTWSDDCRDRGVAVGCFRPPSTPDGTSRLRLTLNAGIPEADFTRALDVILECAP
ncbi:8-amino-7-oxononanoate synthase [Actinoplanes sp. SE50]|uniref:8-amino-7-oxononanoate synthase n=1 Tax=unclassified Actinoplanes TaxID=2626549 RepID=UPI00023ED6D8|nr:MULTISPECIES: 8-amino-7-oxononanoate synthase [unclassified Actinoplanes]AEV87922.1 8-amino-7-oxononanoate synthase [Actinoplanes sp. SE50/110]ATO86326.1 8-amino-7-oxononanoate synthase [Actinoplanes sp. SE50]SLM03741.1 8-amino-7-oxononanoate synthase [Actinoplanes sp. SE50/110]